MLIATPIGKLDLVKRLSLSVQFELEVWFLLQLVTKIRKKKKK
jgi:hypothetical protein